MSASRVRALARRTPCGERGAAAIEFALLVPVLLAILLGVIGFGRAFHVKLELSNAAQEGARLMVFKTAATAAEARTQVINAATLSPPLTAGDISVSGSCGTAGSDVTVTASRGVAFDYVLGAFNTTIVGKAVMRCPG